MVEIVMQGKEMLDSVKLKLEGHLEEILPEFRNQLDSIGGSSQISPDDTNSSLIIHLLIIQVHLCLHTDYVSVSRLRRLSHRNRF